ncbi:hypothetical protein TNCV_5117181 [Trichonephila clavipes]|nr:hypothetical protein TNCV_5117181 [Trichonephila clavipes]
MQYHGVGRHHDQWPHAPMTANVTMTGQRYIDEVLLPHVRLFRGAVGDKFVFMDDNATCDRTLAVPDCLDSEGIQRSQVAGRNYPPTNKNTLILALTEEWDKLPQQLLDNAVQSMDVNRNCQDQARCEHLSLSEKEALDQAFKSSLAKRANVFKVLQTTIEKRIKILNFPGKLNGFQSLVYADKPQTLDHLEDNIRRVIADIRPQMLEKVIENWTSRLDYIRASRGSPMPEIIFKM